MQRGSGFHPSWSDATARVDFSEPVACAVADCELAILTAIGGEDLLARSAVDIPTEIGEDYVLPVGDLWFVDPCFSQRSDLIEFSPTVSVAHHALDADSFPVP